MKDLKEIVYELFKKLCNWYNIDIEKMIAENPTSRRGTLGLLRNQDELFEIYRLHIAGDYDVAYIKAYDKMISMLTYIDLSKPTIESLDEVIVVLQECKQYIADFTLWNDNDRKTFREYIFSNPLLLESDKTDANFAKITKVMFDDCKKVIGTNYIRTNIYKQGNAHIEYGKEYNYKIHDVIVISDNMQQLLSTLKVHDDDLLHYTMMFKIEQIIDYSYFIIVVQYKDTIYFASDYIQFKNPRCATSSRNPQRHRENWWDNVYLPYGIIDDVIEWRKESKDITKDKNIGEIYFKRLTEYLPYINERS